MKNITITFCLGVCILLSSCGDFLDPESKTEYIPRDATALNTALIGYDLLDATKLMALIGVADDDVACQPSGMISVGGVTKEIKAVFETFTWQPDYYLQMMQSGGVLNESGINHWASCYSYIKNINAVLDYADKVSGPEPMRNYVKGQAYALRAWYFFLLANIYSPPYDKNNLEALGIVLKLTSAVELGRLSRSTVGHTYQQIVQDLLDSERYFLESGDSYAYNKNYRINLTTAQLLLSRVYLYMGEWQKSADYASKVIESRKLSMLNLNTDRYGIYKYMDIHSYNNTEVAWVTDKVDDLNAYPNMLGQQPDYGKNPYTIFRASDELIALFDETEGDLRKTEYLRADVATLDNKPSYSYPYYRASAKFAVDNKLNKASGYIYAISFRLVEAYLNRAEANAMLYKELGNGQGRTNAIADLGIIHMNRFKPDAIPVLSPTNADELVQLVREERRKELCFEGHRWFDLRRYGMPEIKHVWCASDIDHITYTLRAGDLSYTLPLPNLALELNSALVQNPQGPRRTN